MKAITPVKLTKLVCINCDWGSTDRKSRNRTILLKRLKIFCKNIQEIKLFLQKKFKRSKAKLG